MWRAEPELVKLAADESRFENVPNTIQPDRTYRRTREESPADGQAPILDVFYDATHHMDGGGGE